MSSQRCSPPLIIPTRSPRKVGRGQGPALVKKSLKASNRPRKKKREKQVHNYLKTLTYQFRSPQKSRLQKFRPKKVRTRCPQSHWPGRRTLYSQDRFLKSMGRYSRSQLQRSNLQGKVFQSRCNAVLKWKRKRLISSINSWKWKKVKHRNTPFSNLQEILLRCATRFKTTRKLSEGAYFQY